MKVKTALLTLAFVAYSAAIFWGLGAAFDRTLSQPAAIIVVESCHAPLGTLLVSRRGEIVSGPTMTADEAATIAKRLHIGAAVVDTPCGSAT